MNKTEKDFQREITRLKQSYFEDQIKYELPFKHELTETKTFKMFFISNKRFSTVLSLDTEFGYMSTTVMARYQLEKCLQMQNELEKGQL
jgi:hypothetical protein